MSNLHFRLQSKLQSLSNQIADSANRLSSFSPAIAGEYHNTFNGILTTIDIIAAEESSLKCQYLMSVLGLNTEQKYTPHKALFQFMEYFDVTELNVANISNDGEAWTLVGDSVSKKKIRDIVVGSEFSYEKVFIFSKWRDRYSIQGQLWAIKEPFSPNVYTSVLTYKDEEEKTLFDRYLARIVGMSELYLGRTPDEAFTELTLLVAEKFANQQPTLVIHDSSQSPDVVDDIHLLKDYSVNHNLFRLLDEPGVSLPPRCSDVAYAFNEAGAGVNSVVCFKLYGRDDVKIVALKCGKRFNKEDEWLYFSILADGTCTPLMDSDTFDSEGNCLCYKRSVFSIDSVIQKLKKMS